MADKLVREGIEALPSIENKGEESPPEQMIIDVLPEPLDSERSNETDEDIPRERQQIKRRSAEIFLKAG